MTRNPYVGPVKIKRLDAPLFQGGVREYPSFKTDYENLMVPCYGNDPFALKKCLSGEALEGVRGVDNDYDEMFRRLNMKYGRPERLIDAVLSELRKLRSVPEGDNKKFINMVNVVENCWLDLKRSKLEAEMNTATMKARWKNYSH